MAESWGRDEVRRLVAEAREDARDEVREVLRRRYAAELLEAVEKLDAPAPAPSAGASPRQGGTALWVYAVSADAHADAPSLHGIDGARVDTVREGALAAYASEVPLDRFDADALREQLEDLERVEQLARAHEGVVEALQRTGTVLPCRLCTIYKSAASLAAMLGRERDSLRAALERLADADEWSVKLLQEEPAEQAPMELATGAEYIAARRQARVQAEQRAGALEAVAAEVHARLTEHAEGAVVGRPQDRRLSGRSGRMLLNGAYLVPRARVDDFRAVVDELAEQHREEGVTLELTGPWPPYHFAGEVPKA